MTEREALKMALSALIKSADEVRQRQSDETQLSIYNSTIEAVQKFLEKTDDLDGNAKGWRKRQICNKVDIDIDPYSTKVRNETIEEVAKAVERFRGAFGADTVSSFAIYIRGLKR